jgi:twitching motility protein PilT
MDPTALGRLCVDRGLIDEEQLEHCLELQQAEPNRRRLGEILLAEGLITGVALANLLSVQARMREERGDAAAAEPARSAPAKNQPATTELAWFLTEAQANGATGLVLDEGQPPALRRGNRLEPLDGPSLGADEIDRMLSETMPQSLLERLTREGAARGTVRLLGAESVRVTLYRHTGGVALALRPTASRPVQLDDLQLPAGVRELIRPGGGLVLLTGPAGSGTSSTLAALLAELSETTAGHLVVIERAKELAIPAGSAWVSRREIGRDADSFARALRATLAADADVVAVAELSYPDSIAAALDVALAGKLVIGIMQTRGAVATVQRILDTFADRRVPQGADALANCLRGILSQRLFPARRGKPVAVAAELLLASTRVAHLIRERTPREIGALLHAEQGDGIISLEHSLARLLKQGAISVDEAIANANDSEALHNVVGVQPEEARVGD